MKGFAGNYGSLLPRDCHELGHGALNDAIMNLYYEHSRQSQRIALLVIIQMVPEAVRIRYIEHLIRRNMLGENLNFIPDAMARSMENVWSALSKQIQWSTSEYVAFNKCIEIINKSNQDGPNKKCKYEVSRRNAGSSVVPL
ncbi:ribosome-inactivating protein bryodin II [Artemisia annua]|uniref:rRNA N-glycosylase n=1 Tax=Artemisia annua TaxID=35608 RepID=A0A2U1LY47_ARTAN|nr:ribosome-inactivating protein bryodin II [Artemisia annua]